MKIIICDDDPLMLSQLRRYIMSYFIEKGLKEPEMECFSSGEELLAADYTADMAFLDVEMPGMSGIYVGRKIKERNPFVKIFIVTSYQEYLDEAMKFRVFRYLSKPLDKARLFRNIRDALHQYSMESVEVPLVTKDKIISLRSNDIMCVEGDSKSTQVYVKGERYESVDHFDFWRKKLQLGSFYQTYRNYLVNMWYVTSFTNAEVEMKCGSMTKTAYLARRKSRDFKDAYLSYLEGIK